MKFIHIFSVLLLSLIPYSMSYAAGGAVTENLAPLFALTGTMITACKKNDTEGFINSVSQALKITAENKNNSMVLPRVSAKLRAAKSAINKGNADEAIKALQEAEEEMQKRRVLAWDGGSE